MAQLPPASQCEMASHWAPSMTGGTSVPGLAPTRTSPGCAGVMTTLATGSLPVSTPFVDAMMPDGSRLHVVIPCEGSMAYTLARRISAQRRGG